MPQPNPGRAGSGARPRPQPTLTTAEFLEAADISDRQLRHLMNVNALTPLRRGRPGLGNSSRWTLLSAVGANYAKQFWLAGLSGDWPYLAARWVATASAADLVAAFGRGEVLLALAPDGSGKLTVPALRPTASRADKLLVAALDLQACTRRVVRRARQLFDQGSQRALADLFAAVGMPALDAADEAT
jgi:hypothetical protein